MAASSSSLAPAANWSFFHVHAPKGCGNSELYGGCGFRPSRPYALSQWSAVPESLGYFSRYPQESKDWQFALNRNPWYRPDFSSCLFLRQPLRKRSNATLAGTACGLVAGEHGEKSRRGSLPCRPSSKQCSFLPSANRSWLGPCRVRRNFKSAKTKAPGSLIGSRKGLSF